MYFAASWSESSLTSFFESLRCVGAGVLAACVAAGFAPAAAGVVEDGPSTVSDFAPFVGRLANFPEICPRSSV